MKDRVCQQCGKSFLVKYYAWHELNGRGKFCSRDCYKLSKVVPRINVSCLCCGKSYFVIPSRVPITKYCSRICDVMSTIGPTGYWLGKKRPDLKFSRSALTMFKSENVSGPKNNHWRGGISEINREKRRIDMQTPEYKSWRLAVYKRDNYACQKCGKKGGVIHADHIKPYASFPELRLNLDNGRTLCVICHRKTPTWGFSSSSTEGGGIYA